MGLTKRAKELRLIKRESIRLKVHATKKELLSLNVKSLDLHWYTKCFYGQMTGNCNSERARILKSLSAEFSVEPTTYKIMSFSSLEYTCLEMLTQKYPEHHSRIIKFLRGEQKTLTLK